MPPKRAGGMVALLPVIVGCLLYLAMALIGVAHESGTYDEFVHVTAGYSYWAFNDYRLNPENGNLAQRIVALPLVLRGNVEQTFPSREQRAWHVSDMWTLSDQFFFGAGKDADALLFAARVPVAIVGALLGALVFFWSRSLFGTAGAYLSFALYVFSPTMLAHGALATSDVIGAAFLIASLWTLWTVLHRITPFTLAASLAVIGGLFLAKPSAPLFIPIGLAMIAVQLIGRRSIALRLGRQTDLESRGSRAGVIALVMLAHVIVAYVFIWAAYGFRYTPFAPGSAASDTLIDSWASMLETPSVTTSLAAWGRAHQILPEAYLYGFATVVAYSRERIAFLNGVVKIAGSHEFFPYAALVKTTLPGLLLMVGAVGVLFVGWRRRRSTSGASHAFTLPLYELTPLLLGVSIYGLSAVFSSLNIGYRHLLPIIPPVMILVGALGPAIVGMSRDVLPWRGAAWPRGRRALAAAGVVVLLLWHAGESLAIAPHYLAYFNEISGGPSQGYRHLIDSSLDWGQDLPGLKRWLDQQGLQGANHLPVYLSYFGTALPGYYKIDALPLAGFPDRSTIHKPTPLMPGVYCFSATMLQAVYFMTPGAWNQRYETDYRSMLDNLKLFDSTATNPAAREALVKQTGQAFWLKNFQVFEHLRTARLAAYLRRREPDEQVGHSILIYRVNEQELGRALSGPSPE
ncbi:MAG TPA: glycosyltransferase family 39 protein [Gemmatimonadaceae bacterium]